MNKHILTSKDGKAAVWAGGIDDLWKMGKPVGQGGPWLDSPTKKDIPSDAYLMACYDKKTVSLSHQGNRPVIFTLEVDPTGDNHFMEYRKFKIEPCKTFRYQFPEGFHGRWIRFKTDADVNATAWLEYR